MIVGPHHVTHLIQPYYPSLFPSSFRVTRELPIARAGLAPLFRVSNFGSWRVRAEAETCLQRVLL